MVLVPDLLQILTVTCLCLVTSSQAWFFSRRYPSARARGRELSKECAAKGQAGSCDFYTCFEERLPCGKNWYNLKYGKPYCVDFRAFASKFSIEGQRFINATESCMGQELMSWYQKVRFNCHDYTHFAFKALSRCYMRNNFCDVVRQDAINFVTIYQPKHLFSRGAFKIWRELLRIAYHCEPQAIKDLVMNFYESWID